MSDQDQMFSVGADLGNTPQQLEKIKKLFEEQTKSIDSYLRATAKLESDSVKQESALNRVAAGFEKLRSAFGGNVTDRYEQQLATVQKAIDALAKTQEDAANRIVAANKSIKQSNAELAAQRKFEREFNAELKKEQQEKRNQDSAALGGLLREQFIPANIDRTSGKFATLETTIKRFEEAARRPRFELDAVINAASTLASTGAATFDGLSVKTTSWFGTLQRTIQALNALANGGNLANLQARIALAAQTTEQFQKQFSTPLAKQNLPTTQVDALISRLGVLVRNSSIAEERLRSIFNATQVSGAIPQLNLTGQELQIARVMERIQTLHQTAITGAQQSAQKQQQYNQSLVSGRTAVQQIINSLTTQFGQLSTPSQLVRLQTILNQIFNTIAKGKIDTQQLLSIFNQLQATNFGKSGPISVLPGNLGTAQNQLLRLSNLFQQTQNAGVDAAKGILLSWQSVFRLFQVQVIHQILGQIITSMRTAVAEASKFEIKISEIRTLSQENQLSVREWTAGLRELSDAFGVPVLDVVKAEYDAISNQVTRGAESFNFLRTSLEFSLVTVSTAKDAQNLLSSAIKSYGTENLTAQKASEVLFKTIDLGRVTASEMANTFGRVAQLAATANVPIEDLGAALATLSVQGIRYSEAYTLINNVLLKLIKPTDEMKQLFGEWGVANGEAALKTFGFVGVLRLLQKEFQSGGLARLGELGENIRAIRGQIGLVTEDAFASFEKNRGEILNGAKEFAEAGKIIRESPAFKLQREIEQINNLFIVDFGVNFVKAIVKLSEPMGGLANGTKVFTDALIDLTNNVRIVLTPIAEFVGFLGKISSSLGGSSAIKIATQALTAYTVATTAARLATFLQGIALSNTTAQLTANTAATVANTTATGAARTGIAGLLGGINPLIAGLTAVTFAYIALKEDAEAYTNTIERELEITKQLEQELANKKFEQQRQTAVDDFKKGGAQSFQDLSLIIADASKELIANLGTIRSTTKLGVSELAAEAANVFSFLESKQQTLEQFVKSTQEEINKSEKQLISLEVKAKTKSFDAGLIGKTDTEQAELALTQIKKLRVEVSEIPITAPETLEEARRGYDELGKIVIKYSEQIENASKQQQKIVADLAVNADKKAFERSLVGLSGTQQTLLTLEKVGQLKAEAQDLFDNGNLEEARKKFDEINSLLEKIFNQQKSFRDRAEKLGVKFSTPLVGGSVDSAINSNDATRFGLEANRLNALQAQQRNLNSQQKAITEELTTLEENYKTQQQDRLQRAIEAQRKLNELQKIQQEITLSQSSIEQLQAKVAESRESAQTRTTAALKQLQDFASGRQKDAEPGFVTATLDPKLFDDLSRVSNQAVRFKEAIAAATGSVTSENLAELARQFDFLRRAEVIAVESMTSERLTFGGPETIIKEEERKKQIEAVNLLYDRQLKLINELAAAKAQEFQAGRDLITAQQGQDAFNARVNGLGQNSQVADILRTFRAEETKIKIVETFNTKFEAQLTKLSTSVDKMIDVLNLSPGKAKGFNLGGIVPSDTHLGWFNPGETIVDVQNSRRFAPELRSITMGFAPKTTTSTSNSVSVGDINVNVSGGSGSIDPRAIGEAINREIRKGSLRLRG